MPWRFGNKAADRANRRHHSEHGMIPKKSSGSHLQRSGGPGTVREMSRLFHRSAQTWRSTMRLRLSLSAMSLLLVSSSAEAQIPGLPPAPTGNVPYSLPQFPNTLQPAMPQTVSPPPAMVSPGYSGHGVPSATGSQGPYAPPVLMPPSGSAASYSVPHPGAAYDYDVYGTSIMMMNPTGGAPAYGAGLHARYPFFSYRAPWYTPGPASWNVTIVW